MNSKNQAVWDREKQVRYQSAWQKYFKHSYGHEPTCQVCSKQLTWDIGDKLSIVNFDHRHGGNEVIRCSPSHWWKRRPCSPENVRIWQDCDFGILCHNCNRALPTKNRLAWIQSVVKYMESL